MAGKELGILEKTIQIIDEYGIIKIFKAFFILIVLFYVLYNGVNVNNIVNGIFERQRLEHDAAVEYRKKIDPEIRLQLNQLIVSTKCDRAFVIELHNGSGNMTGLAFRFGDMTYEEVGIGISEVAEDYRNFNLSRFPFMTYLCNTISWNGTIEELKCIDNKLYLRMLSNDVEYMIFRYFYDKNRQEIGLLGITYTSINYPTGNDLRNVNEEVIMTSGELSKKLDIKQVNIY